MQSTVTYSLGSGIEQLVLMGTGALSGTGNELDNSITGNSGNNTLNGGLGLDTLSGGQGNDTYIIDDVGDFIVEAASAGTDTVRTTLQFYQLDANVENLTFTGIGNFAGTGNGLANILTGGSGDDTLNGGLEVALQRGHRKRHLCRGDIDRSRQRKRQCRPRHCCVVCQFHAWCEPRRLKPDGDCRNGTGNGLANVLTGNGSANTLSGQGGTDRLTGQAGNDTLTGGGAKDVFVFGPGFGRDVVADFAANGGSSDQIEFSTSVFANFSAVQAAMAQVGANVVITYDANNTITLNNVSFARLDASDFLFV